LPCDDFSDDSVVVLFAFFLFLRYSVIAMAMPTTRNAKTIRTANVPPEI
jgi:hypothetical protein